MLWESHAKEVVLEIKDRFACMNWSLSWKNREANMVIIWLLVISLPNYLYLIMSVFVLMNFS